MPSFSLPKLPTPSAPQGRGLGPVRRSVFAKVDGRVRGLNRLRIVKFFDVVLGSRDEQKSAEVQNGDAAWR
jgi:hypothetical protein